jgi:hypothetical protein
VGEDAPAFGLALKVRTTNGASLADGEIGPIALESAIEAMCGDHVILINT